MKRYFQEWIESLDTTENIIEHLQGQRSFHLKFGEFLAKRLKKRENLLEGKVLQWYFKTKDEEFAKHFNITKDREGTTK